METQEREGLGRIGEERNPSLVSVYFKELPVTETDIQQQIVEYLELSGCIVFRMNAGRGRNNQRLAPAGTPDLLVVGRLGKIMWIEVKTDNGKLSLDQEKMHIDLARRYQNVMIARSVDDVYKVAF